MYPKPSLTGAQGNLCPITAWTWKPPCYPAPRSLLPASAKPRGTGWLVWAVTPFPSSPCSPKVSKRGFLGFLWVFFFCCWLQWDMNWSLCTVKGMIKDNVLAVHLVLMGEIPTHGDTSLLIPPICILTPLGNSGGQTKQVCFGLEKSQTNISVYLSGSGIIH